MSESPMTRNSTVQGQQKMNISSQLEKVNWPFLHLFVLFKPTMDWMMPTLTGEGDLYSACGLTR